MVTASAGLVGRDIDGVRIGSALDVADASEPVLLTGYPSGEEEASSVLTQVGSRETVHLLPDTHPVPESQDSAVQHDGPADSAEGPTAEKPQRGLVLSRMRRILGR